MSELYWLSEAQFEKIKPLLPNKMRGVKRVEMDTLAIDKPCIAQDVCQGWFLLVFEDFVASIVQQENVQNHRYSNLLLHF